MVIAHRDRHLSYISSIQHPFPIYMVNFDALLYPRPHKRIIIQIHDPSNSEIGSHTGSLLVSLILKMCLVALGIKSELL